MSRRRLQALRTASPSPPEDFKHIHGIGPAFESRLHNAGIRTFAQLGTLSPEEIAACIPGVSARRVAKLGWIQQARKLAPKKPHANPGRKKTEIPTPRQHYSNFAIEFLLDEKNEARRTHAVHVQSGDADTWAGWEMEQLIDFLARHTRVHSEPAKSISGDAASPALAPRIATETVQAISRTAELVQPVTATAPVSQVTTTAEPCPQIGLTVQSTPPALVAAEQIDPHEPQIRLTGELHSFSMETAANNISKPQRILRSNQAFEIRLSLDLTDLEVTGNPSLNYIVLIYAKNMDGGLYQVISEAHDTMTFKRHLTLIAHVAGLPHGLYRLEAAVTLMPHATSPDPRPSLRAWIEGGLLQVY